MLDVSGNSKSEIDSNNKKDYKINKVNLPQRKNNENELETNPKVALSKHTSPDLRSDNKIELSNVYFNATDTTVPATPVAKLTALVGEFAALVAEVDALVAEVEALDN